MPGMKPKEGVNGEEMETEWSPNFYVRCFKEARSDRGLYEPSKKSIWTVSLVKEPYKNISKAGSNVFEKPNFTIRCRVLMLDFSETRLNANSQFQIAGPECLRQKFIWATFPMTLARGKLVLVQMKTRLFCPFFEQHKRDSLPCASFLYSFRMVVGHGQACECWSLLALHANSCFCFSSPAHGWSSNTNFCLKISTSHKS